MAHLFYTNLSTLTKYSNHFLTTIRSLRMELINATEGELILTKGVDTLEQVNYNKCWHTNNDCFYSGSTLQRVELFKDSNGFKLNARNYLIELCGINEEGNEVIERELVVILE